MKRFAAKKWYPYTVALCIAVVLYVALTHIPAIRMGIHAFNNYFAPVIVGCIIAYLMNPLAKVFERTIFKNMKKLKWAFSVGLTFIAIVIAIMVLILALIPQLVISISAFIDQLPGYQATLQEMMTKLGVSNFINVPKDAKEVTDAVGKFLADHSAAITSTSSGAIKTIINVVIGAVLSLYLLNSKSDLKKDTGRLVRALLSEEQEEKFFWFTKRCDLILSRYMVFTLLDSLIVGVANAIIMLILRMPYVGLISIIVGITNLIPTFGPVIGGAIGGFLLLLVSPKYAVMFILITIVLQIVDGYILKPKLFGNTLGVSGLLILIAIVTLGNIFGIVGILLAIPVAAICDFSYREAFLPYLEKRNNRGNGESEERD